MGENNYKILTEEEAAKYFDIANIDLSRLFLCLEDKHEFVIDTNKTVELPDDYKNIQHFGILNPKDSDNTQTTL